MAYGTISVLDTLAAQLGQNVAQYGEDRAFESISVALDAHNANLQEALADMVTVTSQRLFPYGNAGQMEMRYVDEFGAVDVQKGPAGQNVGIPLRTAQIALGWTRHAFNRMTPRELASKFQAANDADVKFIMDGVAAAFFKPTNTLTYIDREVDSIALPLRALLNADGQVAPSSADSVAFDGDHSHYAGVTSLTAAAVSALIENVREHGVSGDMVLYINRAQEAAIRGMENFQPYIDNRVVLGSANSYAMGELKLDSVNNRAIGVFDGAEVAVKPWVRPGYLLAVDVRSSETPLAIRTVDGTLTTGQGALQIVSDHEHYPLRAQHMERQFGVGVLNRHKAAALYVGGPTYVMPMGL